MKKKIILSGTEIEYELTRKKVKNINLRIRSDGSVAVSASKLVPIAVIENLIISKSDFILSAIARQSKKAVPVFESGCKISVLGEEKTLIIKSGQKNHVAVDCDTVILTVKESANVKRIFEEWLKQLCFDTVSQICADVYPYFRPSVAAFPQIKVKSMVSRWGSCHPTKNILTFSSYLMYAPLSCVRYVVLHEFTHFLHANHSKAFYNELEKTAPDWKSCKQILKQIKIR